MVLKVSYILVDEDQNLEPSQELLDYAERLVAEAELKQWISFYASRMNPMVDAEALAWQFHETYERLAPSFGYETRKETKAFDPDSPNGRLMIAVCQEVGDLLQQQSFNAGFQTALMAKSNG